MRRGIRGPGESRRGAQDTTGPAIPGDAGRAPAGAPRGAADVLDEDLCKTGAASRNNDPSGAGDGSGPAASPTRSRPMIGPFRKKTLNGAAPPAAAPHPTTAAVAVPVDGADGAPHADDGIHDPRVHATRLFERARAWFADLDLSAPDGAAAIHWIVEKPGAGVLWALKLGRFPLTAQLALRDQNTVAGMLTWLYLLAFVVAAAG